MFISDIRNRDRDTVYIDAESGTEFSLIETGEDDNISGIPEIEISTAAYDECREQAWIRERGKTEGKADSLRTGMRYLTASLIIAAAAAVYGLFSHGVYSYYMTYAFMIPLLGGAMPHLIAALKGSGQADRSDRQAGPAIDMLPEAKDLQIAVIATLTVGSLLKGALDIYGTTNHLLIAYPVIAALLVLLAFILYKTRAASGKDRV